jgi:subtilisin family serine protease
MQAANAIQWGFQVIQGASLESHFALGCTTLECYKAVAFVSSNATSETVLRGGSPTSPKKDRFMALNFRITRNSVLAIAAFATAACGLGIPSVALAGTVEFKVNLGLKGRNERQVMDALQSIGPMTSTATPGVYKMDVPNEEIAIRALREQKAVIWAQEVGADTNPISEASIEFHERMLAVELKAGADAKSVVALLAQATGQDLRLKRVSNGNRALVTLSAQTTAASLAALVVAAERVADVSKVTRVRVMKHQWLPNDSLWGQQWSLGSGVGGIRASSAWDITPSGSVQVAVIDTGIRSHPDLDAKHVAGYDMIRERFLSVDGDGRDDDPSDPGDYQCPLDNPFGDTSSSWHGTHVAGIVAAATNNGDGISGVAPNARIQSVRALGRCGGTDDDVADAIRWSAGVPVAGVPNNANPSKVLNLSLGGDGPCSDNMQSAVDAAIARGAIVVVAAGNSRELASGFSPANCKGVISVVASNLLGDISSYSNYGSGVTLSAPGGDFGNLPGVLSTLNGSGTAPGAQSYAVYSGTSMAAPHVAGVVALMLARDPSLTSGQIVNRLTAAAKTFTVGSECATVGNICGKGLLDAANAVGAVPINRGVNDVASSRERVHAVELRNRTTGRYVLSTDPVEIARLLSGTAGAIYDRTGQVISVFSFTAAAQSLALPQTVCRARLKSGGAMVFSTNAGECKAYAANGGLAMDGMVFNAALPNPNCPLGSDPVYELVQLDGFGYNVRTIKDAAEISRMQTNGWTNQRIAFCAPN